MIYFIQIVSIDFTWGFFFFFPSKHHYMAMCVFISFGRNERHL